MFTPYERPSKKGVEEAKQSLVKAIEAKKYTKSSVNIQKTFRRFLARQKVSSLVQSGLSSKISDLKKLRQMLGDKLKYLPVKALIDLIRSCRVAKSPALLYELRDWIDASVCSPDPQQNLMCEGRTWDLTVYTAVTFAELFKKNKELTRYLINILQSPSSISSFYKFLLLLQLFNENSLLTLTKQYLTKEILLASNNISNKAISELLDLVITPNLLFYKIDITQLQSEDQSLAYNGFVEMQTYIVEEILSIPRIAKFLLQHARFGEVKWKEMIQSYCYTQVVNKPHSANQSEKEIFLFGNLWELFQTKLFASMSPSDISHLLLTCTKLVRHLSPRLLECSSMASISEPVNIKTLRRQIAMFTDSSKLNTVFLKIFNHESDGFDDTFNPLAAQSLCEIYNIFLEKCRESKEAQFVVTGIMGGLAFNKKIIYKIWKFLEVFCDLRVFYNAQQIQDRESNFYKYSHVLSIFCSAYRNLLLIANDQEFPYVFSKEELQKFTFFSIDFVHTILCLPVINETVENLLQSVSLLLKLIHEFNQRLKFLNENEFLLAPKAIQALASNTESLNRVIAHFPFCLPFDARVEILSTRISETKDIYSTYPSTRIIVRRETLMADSISQLLGAPDIRGRLEVKFINIFGTIEEGYDAGGLFKEFWTSLSGEAFNPAYGLFSVTKDQCLYPNPDSKLFFGNEHLGMFYLVGRILGKAIFERITVEPKFAEFFLRKMIGKYNFVEDLKSLDMEVYNNLMFLKNYEGNTEDLSLSFTVNSVDGSEFELKPKGRDTAVTTSNKLEYIYKFADYRLNLQIKSQCGAFFKGFSELIPSHWLSMFTSSEMQTIISGTAEDINIEDLKAYTIYIDCNHRDNCAKNFWKVMESFTTEERSLVLKFVTSCPRPPLLGFKNLFPPFTISKAAIDRDDEKLPSAQTCMNILRVPTYSSWKVLREKLLIAIKSGAGFEFQ